MFKISFNNAQHHICFINIRLNIEYKPSTVAATVAAFYAFVARVNFWQEAQLSIAERCATAALYQLKCRSTVIRITQVDRAWDWGALSITATFYYASCIVFKFTFVHKSLH